MALGDLTASQREFLERFLATDLAGGFYLSGGTALSAFYLHHRRSDDLDLFSRDPFDQSAIARFVASLDARAASHKLHDRLGFILHASSEPLKVEFVRYGFDPIEPPLPRLGALRVDSLRDILANKLSAMIERNEPKDYCDLLFLVRQAGLDLNRGIADCKLKFGWPGLEHLLQTAFLRRLAPSTWPETEPRTTPDEASTLFRDAARSLVRLEE